MIDPYYGSKLDKIALNLSNLERFIGRLNEGVRSTPTLPPKLRSLTVSLFNIAKCDISAFTALTTLHV